MRTEGLQDPCKRGNNCVNCFNLQQCFPVCACKTHLLWQQNISEKVKKHFLFSIPKKVSATNFSSLCKRGNVVAETMFPQQCFFICRGLYPPAPWWDATRLYDALAIWLPFLLFALLVLFHFVSCYFQLGIPNSFALASYTRKIEKDMKLKGAIKYVLLC